MAQKNDDLNYEMWNDKGVFSEDWKPRSVLEDVNYDLNLARRNANIYGKYKEDSAKLIVNPSLSYQDKNDEKEDTSNEWTSNFQTQYEAFHNLRPSFSKIYEESKLQNYNTISSGGSSSVEHHSLVEQYENIEKGSTSELANDNQQKYEDFEQPRENIPYTSTSISPFPTSSNHSAMTPIISNSSTWTEAMEKLKKEVDDFEEKWRWHYQDSVMSVPRPDENLKGNERQPKEIFQEFVALPSISSIEKDSTNVSIQTTINLSDNQKPLTLGNEFDTHMPSLPTRIESPHKGSQLGSNGTSNISDYPSQINEGQSANLVNKNLETELLYDICERILKNSTPKLNDLDPPRHAVKCEIQVRVTLTYVNICSAILGKFPLPRTITMRVIADSLKEFWNGLREGGESLDLSIDPREFFKEMSPEYDEIHEYLTYSTNKYDFKGMKSYTGNNILTFKQLPAPILLYLEHLTRKCIHMKCKFVFDFTDSGTKDFFLHLFQDSEIKRNAFLTFVIGFFSEKKYQKISSGTFETPYTIPTNYPKKESNDANVVFLDINYIEYTKEEDWNISIKYGTPITCPSVELIGLGAYHCRISEKAESLQGISLKEMIYPSWCNDSSATHHTKESENAVLKKIDMGWSKLNLTYDKLSGCDAKEMSELLGKEVVCSLRDGKRCVNERKAMENLCTFLESVACKHNCKEILLVVCCSQNIYSSDIQTIAPLRILLSKIRQYCLEELFYKHVVGYTDLLTKKVRQDYDLIHGLIAKKSQALSVMKEFDDVMLYEKWPRASSKENNQALAGLMCLIDYKEQGILHQMINLPADKMKIPKNSIFKSTKNLFNYDTFPSLIIICQFKGINFVSNKRSFDTLKLHSKLAAKKNVSTSSYSHRSFGDETSKKELKIDGKQYVCQLPNVPIGTEKRSRSKDRYFISGKESKNKAVARNADRNRSEITNQRFRRSVSRDSGPSRSSRSVSRSDRSGSQTSDNCSYYQNQNDFEDKIVRSRNKQISISRSRVRDEASESRESRNRKASEERSSSKIDNHLHSRIYRSRSKSRKRSHSRSNDSVDKRSKDTFRMQRQSILQEQEKRRDRRAIAEIEKQVSEPYKTNDRNNHFEGEKNSSMYYDLQKCYTESSFGSTSKSEDKNEIFFSTPEQSVHDGGDQTNSIYVNKMKNILSSHSRPQSKLPIEMRVDVCNNLNKNVEGKKIQKSKDSCKSLINVDSRPFGFLQNKDINYCSKKKTCENDRLRQKQPSKYPSSSASEDDSTNYLQSMPMKCDKGYKKEYLTSDNDYKEKVRSRTKIKIEKNVPKKSTSNLVEPTHVSMDAKGLLNFRVVSKGNETILKPSPLAAIAQYSSESSGSEAERNEEGKSWKEQSKRFWKYNP